MTHNPDNRIPQEDELTPERLNDAMDNIKYMKAMYAGARTFIECHPEDKGAIQVGEIWVQEFDIKPGADWQIRRFKFAIQERAATLDISRISFKTFINWLWGYKYRKND